MRKSRKDAERKKSRMSGEHKRGGAAHAAGSSRATGSGGSRFSKSTHRPPASARGGQPAGRGRAGGSMRGSKAGMLQHVQPLQMRSAVCVCAFTALCCVTTFCVVTLSVECADSAWPCSCAGSSLLVHLLCYKGEPIVECIIPGDPER